MSQSTRTRIAVYGGDDRVDRIEWPKHLDVCHYPYKSPAALRSLQQAASSGSLDGIVVLTRYTGHSGYHTVKDMGVQVTHWPRSPGELGREIGRLFPPPDPPVNPLLIPTPASRNDGPGRGPLPVKADHPKDVNPTVESRSTTVADRDLPSALWRLLRESGLTQGELARMIGRAQSTVSGWFTGRSHPTDMGPLIVLWPELRRFDVKGPRIKRSTGTAPPKATPATDDLLVRWRRAMHDVAACVRALGEAQARLEAIQEEMMTAGGDDGQA